MSLITDRQTINTVNLENNSLTPVTYTNDKALGCTHKLRKLSKCFDGIKGCCRCNDGIIEYADLLVRYRGGTIIEYYGNKSGNLNLKIQCGDNHKVFKRYYKAICHGSWCPECNGKSVYDHLEDYCKKENKKCLIDEWDEVRNGKMTNYTKGSKKKVWWICSQHKDCGS